MKKITITISGMTCASCALNNEKRLMKTLGIISANVNFASKKANIEYGESILDSEHPLSRAVFKYVKEKNSVLVDFSQTFKELEGRGMVASCPIFII